MISILPRKSAYIESLGKLKNDSKLLKIMLILALFFIMPIITEKMTINPPTCMVVEIALSIAFLKA